MKIYIAAKDSTPESIYSAVATYKYYYMTIEDAKKYRVGYGYNTILELTCDDEGNINSKDDIKIVYEA